ncbi:putative reverse transcriptase domain-containing protein, partial [Tanacetum coccineum]
MPPRRAPSTRTIPAIATSTTSVTDVAIKALISRGVADALAEHEIQRNNNLNGDVSQGSGSGITRPVRPIRECTYTDFLKCQPMIFKGMEGVGGLTQWFERMETVFNISNCAVENQVKFATCTLHGFALTWWKSHVKTVGHDANYNVSWNTLMKMMTAKYYPRNEIKKLEMEIWELKVKGTDLASYTQRFQELALMCGRMFPEESDKIEKYVGGLPDMIHGSIIASKPKTMQDTVEFATELMDKKIRTFVERQTENKRKNLTEDLNLCAPNATITMMVCVLLNAASQKVTCFECGAQGHFKRECLKLKNNNHGNQGENGIALAKVCGGQCRDKPGLKYRYGSQLDNTPTTSDHYYDVELVDKKIIGINTIIRGCTLNFLNHPFNIDLMPIELGSFDVIIGMDWLAKYKVVIVCVEKIVHIPWGNETLIVRGDGSYRGNEARLNIISCTKMQKYMLKGCHVFLAHVTSKKTEDKSEGKRFKDVSIVRDFPKVFLE